MFPNSKILLTAYFTQTHPTFPLILPRAFFSTPNGPSFQSEAIIVRIRVSQDNPFRLPRASHLRDHPPPPLPPLPSARRCLKWVWSKKSGHSSDGTSSRSLSPKLWVARGNQWSSTHALRFTQTIQRLHLPMTAGADLRSMHLICCMHACNYMCESKRARRLG